MSWSASREHEYPHFVAALSLIAALPPSEARALLRHRLDRLAPLRDEIHTLIDGALANGVPALFLVEEEYRLAMLAAEAEFVTRLLGQLTDPQTDWLPGWAAVPRGVAYRLTRGTTS